MNSREDPMSHKSKAAPEKPLSSNWKTSPTSDGLLLNQSLSSSAVKLRGYSISIQFKDDMSEEADLQRKVMVLESGRRSLNGK